MSLQGEYQIRYENTKAWLAGFMEGDAYIELVSGDTWTAKSHANDIEVIRSNVGFFVGALIDLNDYYVAPASWQSAFQYNLGQVVLPTAPNGFRYVATTEGVTAGAEPTWPGILGQTVTDGGVVWECFTPEALVLWDQYWARFLAEVDQIVGLQPVEVTGIRGWQRANNQLWFPPNLTNDRTYPNPRNGHGYKATAWDPTLVGNPANVETGASPPAWPTTGGSVQDGDITWQDQGAYWTASTPVALGAIVDPHVNPAKVWRCTTAGTTGVSEPSWSADTINDGGVVWTSGSAGNEEIDPAADGTELDFYARQFSKAMDDVRAAAGIITL